MGAVFVISPSYVTSLALYICWSTTCTLTKPVWKSSRVGLLNSTFPRTVAYQTNFCEGLIARPPSPYIVSILFVMAEVWPIISVSVPITYNNFTCCVLGYKSIAVNRVSSPFRPLRSLPCMLRKLKMALAFFSCVAGAILLISVATAPNVYDGVPL